MCRGRWRDSGRFLIVANAALSVLGTRFGVGWFLCDLPLAVGVGGFLYDGIAIFAGFPMVGGIGCPCVTKGVGVGGGGGGNMNSHILMPFDTINSAVSAITDFDLCAIDLKISPPIGLTH